MNVRQETIAGWKGRARSPSPHWYSRNSRPEQIISQERSKSEFGCRLAGQFHTLTANFNESQLIDSAWLTNV